MPICRVVDFAKAFFFLLDFKIRIIFNLVVVVEQVADKNPEEGRPDPHMIF